MGHGKLELVPLRAGLHVHPVSSKRGRPDERRCPVNRCTRALCMVLALVLIAGSGPCSLDGGGGGGGGKTIRLKTTVLSKTSIRLDWTMGGNAEKFVVRKGGKNIGTTSGRTYTVTSLKPGKRYCFVVKAKKWEIWPLLEKVIGRSSSKCARTWANPAPGVPPDVTVEVMGVGAVELAWGESSDDGVVDGYAIYRDGEEVAFINRWMDRRYLDEGLVSASTYCYEVRAEDTEGARSEPMTPICATTLTDTTPPEAPLCRASPFQQGGGDHVSVWWNAVEDDGTVVAYRVLRDDETIAMVESTSSLDYADHWLLPQTIYSYSVIAIDSAGNESVPGRPFVTETSWLRGSACDLSLTSFIWGDHGNSAFGISDRPYLLEARGGLLNRFELASRSDGGWSSEVIPRFVSPTVSRLDFVPGHMVYDEPTGLTYGRGSGTDWVFEDVDAAFAPATQPSMAVTGQVVHVACRGAEGRPEYRRRDGGVWSREVIDPAAFVAETFAYHGPRTPQLAIDSEGRPRVLYATGPSLRLATRLGAHDWVVVELDAVGALVGDHALATGPSSRVAVIHQGPDGEQAQLREWNGAVWSVDPVEGVAALGVDLTYDATGALHISSVEPVTGAPLYTTADPDGEWVSIHPSGRQGGRTLIEHDGRVHIIEGHSFHLTRN